MGRLLLMVLIVLLPLRAWSVERMAIQMVQHELPSSAMKLQQGSMSKHCLMMMAKTHLSDEAQQGKDKGHSDTPVERGCQACQLCMSLISTPLPITAFFLPQPQRAVMQGADRFASADLTRAAKPPIF